MNLAEQQALTIALAEAIEYTESVDALLDGIIPTRKDPKDPTSEQIWLKERVQLLIDQNESTADKLSECWIFLDRIASMNREHPLCKRVGEFLTKQGTPGWKDEAKGGDQ